jgi:hypothetical protein
MGENLINADRNGQDFITEPEGSTAFDSLTQGDFQEAAFFLQFQMPVGFRRELSGVRNAQLALAREHSRLEDTELNQIHLLATAWRELDFTYRNAQTHYNRWVAASREVASAEAKFAGGKEGLLDTMLDAERRRAQAQRDYYQAVADYNKALAEIHFRKGSLLEYDNVYLAEGPWPQKAYWDALEHARERDASYYMDYGWTRPRVVSQGPTAQQTGTANDILDRSTPTFGERTTERIPEPESVPAEPAPEPLPQGPITFLPDGPTLDAPRQVR